MTDARFADLRVSPPIVRAITETMGYEFMTRVQLATLPVALAGEADALERRGGTVPLAQMHYHQRV